jgi:hypothetical protein
MRRVKKEKFKNLNESTSPAIALSRLEDLRHKRSPLLHHTYRASLPARGLSEGVTWAKLIRAWKKKVTSLRVSCGKEKGKARTLNPHSESL